MKLRLLPTAMLLAVPAVALAAHAPAPAYASTTTPDGQPLPHSGIVGGSWSIGMNTHVNYDDGTYNSAADPQAAERADLVMLRYLGVTTIRDNVPNPSFGSAYTLDQRALESLAADGIRQDLLDSDFTDSLDYSAGQIDLLQEAHPGSVVAVEGPNEVNNNPPPGDPAGFSAKGTADAIAFQKSLYSFVKNDPHLAGVQVFSFTGGIQYDPLTDAGGTADVFAAHPYPYPSTGSLQQQPYLRMMGEDVCDYRMPPYGDILPPALQPNCGINTAYKPDDPAFTYAAVHTETGYADPPTGSITGDEVDATTAARGTLDLAADSMLTSVPIYFYQLEDAYGNAASSEDAAFGFFGYNPAFASVAPIPKAKATALHNLAVLLGIPTSNLALTGAGSATPVPAEIAAAPGVDCLDYTVQNLPPNSHVVLRQRNPGVYDLLFWAEPVDWNPSTKSPASVAPTGIWVNFTYPNTYAAYYVPRTGTNAVAWDTHTSASWLPLSDDLLVLEVHTTQPATQGACVN